jgi:hypothetical protein
MSNASTPVKTTTVYKDWNLKKKYWALSMQNRLYFGQPFDCGGLIIK